MRFNKRHGRCGCEDGRAGEPYDSGGSLRVTSIQDIRNIYLNKKLCCLAPSFIRSGLMINVVFDLFQDFSLDCLHINSGHMDGREGGCSWRRRKAVNRDPRPSKRCCCKVFILWTSKFLCLVSLFGWVVIVLICGIFLPLWFVLLPSLVGQSYFPCV